MTIFPELEENSGYWLVEIAGDDGSKKVFTPYQGVLRFKRMDFGFVSNAGTVQFSMVVLLTQFKFQSAFAYLHNIVILSRTPGRYMSMLENFWRCVMRTASNWTWKVQAVHQLQGLPRSSQSSWGLEILTHRTGAIRRLQYPANESELRPFFGLSNGYRRFVAHVARVVTLLNRKPCNGQLQTFERLAYDETNAFHKTKESLV